MTSTRRSLIGGAAAIALAPIPRGRAQGRAKLTIGVLTDLSGTYRDNTGPTSVAATQLAVDEMKPHLDCDIEVISADHQNKPDVAVSIARQWFDSGVDVAADVPTSSVALAVAQVAKEKDKLMLNASATVASLTDDQCSPNYDRLEFRYLRKCPLDRRIAGQGGLQVLVFHYRELCVRPVPGNPDGGGGEEGRRRGQRRRALSVP